ncbi:hypothetical protein [Ekhidna sp.]
MFFQLIISNVIALALLFVCWKYPRYGRYAYGVIFLIAGVVNIMTTWAGPSVYLQYRNHVILKVYRAFIDGYFEQHIQEIILVIAIGQFLLALGFFYGSFLLKPAIIGGIVFSIALIPLGIGAALPLPIIMGFSLWVLLAKGSHFDKVLT